MKEGGGVEKTPSPLFRAVKPALVVPNKVLMLKCFHNILFKAFKQRFASF
jgi:hypothetical protein